MSNPVMGPTLRRDWSRLLSQAVFVCHSGRIVSVADHQTVIAAYQSIESIL